MPRADLLLTLVQAGWKGDRRLLRSAAEALAAEERARQHHVLADRLLKTFENGSDGESRGTAPLSATARDVLVERIPRRRLEEVVLPTPVRRACEQLVEEQRRADLLRAHGLEPRHRLLLVGPPGNGKTLLAEAIAEALAVPFLILRYDAVVGSFLGETASRLRRLFDYARTVPCVLFFDEFDSLGKERGDTHETGEIKRVVSSLLLQIDDLPSYTVVVAATNHPELLDRAVWRRFQLRLTLPAPSLRDLAAFLAALGRRFDLAWPRSPRSIAQALGPVSYAEAEEFCLTVARRRALSLGEAKLAAIVTDELALWRERRKVFPRPLGETANGGAPPSSAADTDQG
ncbi:MAG: ATP-binding protein [Elioraea sp.]|nr:ATP-binding protein [Elioraea sp.]